MASVRYNFSRERESNYLPANRHGEKRIIILRFNVQVGKSSKTRLRIYFLVVVIFFIILADKKEILPNAIQVNKG